MNNKKITVENFFGILWLIILALSILGYKLNVKGNVLIATLLLIITVPIIVFAGYKIENSRKYIIIVIIGIILSFIGIINLYIENINGEKFIVNKHIVYNVENNKIEVDGKNGDHKYLEIKSPIIKLIKEGNVIRVKYEKENQSNYSLVILSNIGTKIYIIGFLLSNIWVIYIVIYVLKKC